MARASELIADHSPSTRHGAVAEEGYEVPLIRRVTGDMLAEPDGLITREWLVTNALGGYASGTISGVITRRYHGLLTAALPAPLGRRVMLSHLSERLRLPDGTVVLLGGKERVGGLLELHGAAYLAEFRLENGIPIWRYELHGFVMEKLMVMPHLQNTVHITYRLLEGDGPLRLNLRPSLNFRHYEAPVNQPLPSYSFSAKGEQYEICSDPDEPGLKLLAYGDGRSFTVDGITNEEVLYRVEARRGYESAGALWSPGYFRFDVGVGSSATIVASTEAWESMRALTPDEALAAETHRRARLLAQAHPRARTGVPAELVLAADQFIITPAGRAEEAARARAAGDEVRTVIAGYHWFTDWGRDTMISLEGLTIATGRHIEAGYILRTFAHYVRDGLIPNMFPDRDNEGLYHTADATLWFFHALHRYVEATADAGTLAQLLPTLHDIVRHHLEGTRFGIGMDPADGLMRQGAAGYQLTWMDAKVGDWVVTPRRGKAVEINALWYNALRLLERWTRDAGDRAAAHNLAAHAERVQQSFNARFWIEDAGYLYDVIDGEQGDDPACRPNQVLAISLDHPVLDRSRWEAVLDAVRRELVTPVGLRSLARANPEYKSQYHGDLRARDAAYHQGTAWGWLVGPFVDAWLKLHPDDRTGAHRWLEGFVEHLDTACIGSISEIFDAEYPFTPRGCVAQAWSVAEVLRCWVKTQNPAMQNSDVSS